MAYVYHSDPISCEVLKHLVQNRLYHMIVWLSHHEADRGGIHICGKLICSEYRLSCNRVVR